MNKKLKLLDRDVEVNQRIFYGIGGTSSLLSEEAKSASMGKFIQSIITSGNATYFEEIVIEATD